MRRYAAGVSLVVRLKILVKKPTFSYPTAGGVKIDSMKVDLESVIDLNGMFGLKDIRPGISDVKVLFHVKSDADKETLQEILNSAQSLSPVYDSVTKPVKVKNVLMKE